MGKLRQAGLLTLVLLGVLLLGLSAGLASAGAAQFVPAPARSDIRFDDARGVLYISSGAQVLRFDVSSGRFLTPFEVGGDLRGMDISPDGRTLAAADDTFEGDRYKAGRSVVRLVDIDSGKVTRVTFPRNTSETGTWMVAFARDGRLLISSRVPGWSAGASVLRAWEASTGVVVLSGPIDGNAVLSAAGDRSLIGVSQPESGIGNLGYYYASSRSLVLRRAWTGGTTIWGSICAVDRNGSRITASQGMYTDTYNGDGSFRRFVDAMYTWYAYSPTADRFFTTSYGSSVVTEYDSASYSPTATYDLERELGTPGADFDWGFPSVIPWPRSAIGRDNALLALTSKGGVSYVRSRPVVVGTVRSSTGHDVEGATVELWRKNAGGWSLDATTTTGPSGSWSHAFDDSATVRVRADGTSAGHGATWFGGASLDTASDVDATTTPSVSADTTVTVVGGGSLGGTLTSTWTHGGVAGLSVSLLSEDDSSTVLGSAITDGAGHFSLSGLEAMRYRLRFSDSSGQYRTSYYGTAQTFTAGARVTVHAGASATVTDTVTYLPFKLAGLITSTFADTEVPGAGIGIWRLRTDGQYAFETTITAGADGTFSYETDNPAPVRLHVVDPVGMRAPTWLGGTSLADAADVVPTRADPTPLTRVRMAIPNAGTMSGVVGTTKTGGPASGITVFLRRYDTNSTVATAVTDVAGTYRFEGVDVGVYVLYFEDPRGAHKPVYMPWIEPSYYKYYATQWTIDGPGAVRDCGVMWMTWLPARIRGYATSSFFDLRVPQVDVEFWRRGSDGRYSLEKTMLADSGFVYESDDIAPIRVRWVDRSGMHAPTWYGGTSLDTAADLIPIRGGYGPESGVQMPLASPATIQGSVRSSRGAVPLGGVRVGLYLDTYLPYELESTVTAADGTYRFDNLGPYGFRLSYSDAAGNHYPQFFSGAGDVWSAAVVGISRTETRTADATLQFVPYQVRGAVKSTYRDKPVAGAKVGVWRQDEAGGWTRESTVTADASGAWSLSTETTAAVRLQVVDPNGAHDPTWIGGTGLGDSTVFVPDRGGLPVANVTLTMSHPASISGTVRSSKASAPVPGAIVTLLADDAGVRSVIATCATDAAGGYRFDGLGPSSFRMSSSDPSGDHFDFGPGSLIAIAGPVSLTRNITMEFVPFDLQGVVTSDYHGLPVPDATVEIWRPDASGTWAVEDVEFTDLDGGWMSSLESTSPARVRVIDPGLICEPAWVGGIALESATAFTPARENPTEVDVRLHVARPATISGRVTDSYSGEPVSGVTVSLCPAYTDMVSVITTTTTAADGSYHFDGLSPSDYLVYFSDPSDRYWAQWYDYEDSADWADSIWVSTPGVQSANAELDAKRIQFRASFTTATVSAGDGDSWAGHPFTLSAVLVDNIWGWPMQDVPVVVQSSLDRVHWVNIGGATSLNDGQGTYSFNCVASDAAARYYRFAVATTPDIVATQSPDVFTRPALRVAAWQGITINGAPATSTPTPVGSGLVVLEGSLLDVWSSPVAHAPVRVMQSADGRTWYPAPSILRESAPGHYVAKVSSGHGSYYRLEATPGGTSYPATSNSVRVYGPRAVECWPSNWLPRHGRKVRFSVWLWPRSKVGSRPATITIQRKIGRVFKTIGVYKPKVFNGTTNSSRATFSVAFAKQGRYRYRTSGMATTGFKANTTAWTEFTVR